MEIISFCTSIRFVSTAHSAIPFFRRTHVSALNFCKSLFRLLGVAINIQPHGLDAYAKVKRGTAEGPAQP